jgi:hypothetical protein
MSNCNNQDNEKHISIKVQEKYDHHLNFFGGTGHDWYIKSVNDIEYEHTTTLNNDELIIESNLVKTNLVGGNKTRIFTITPLTNNNFVIVFEKIRLWDKVGTIHTLNITITN